MTFERLVFGKRGEKAAEAYLKKQGYRILKRNYRTKVGEIDLIAEHNNILVFIEVKSRTDAALEHPFMAVTPKKQKKIAQTARSFLAQNKVGDRQIRFDVVSVLPGTEKPDSLQVEVLQDAFRV
jgi:putative endonuclease